MSDYSDIVVEDDGGEGIARFTRADHFKSGETGDAVEQLNAFLIAAGFLTEEELAKQGGRTDIVGTGTKNAIIYFQRAMGLPVDDDRNTISADELRDIRAYLQDQGLEPNAEMYDQAGGRELLTDFGPTSKTTNNTPGTEAVGNTVLPEGMRLVKVTNPAGSDAAAIYYAVGDVYGVEVAYEIGTQDDLTAEFGGVDAFGSFSTVTQTQFDNSDILTVGPVDEIMGSTESLQAQYERDMRAAGLEAPPQWMLNDPTAMATFVTATNEGWSAERTWGALAKLDSFKERFGGIETIQNQLGTGSVHEAVGEYLSRESEVRAALLRYRGPNTNVDTEYVSSLIGAGWQGSEVADLLELEREVKENQAALENINEILVYRGLDPLTPDDFADYLRDEARTSDPDFTPGEVFEAVNDALRLTALEQAGIEGISAEVAASLGTGISYSIDSPDMFNDEAQYVAGVVAANAHALDLGSYGLDQDKVLQHFLGQSDDPDVGRKLEKLGRERNIAAQGYASTSAYIDAEGRLRAQGLSDA